MTELRSVDPRSLQLNPNNPRTTPANPQMDAELLASIKAIGIIQPPVVREFEGRAHRQGRRPPGESRYQGRIRHH